MGGTIIKAGAKVSHCIIAEDVVVGAGSVIGAAPTETENGVATIGPNVKIGAGAQIGPNAMIDSDVKEGEVR
jgi:glucose-1-phosphate adenylyltransferase